MSFDPFGDFETAGYLQNALSLKDPIEIKESEHLSFEASIEEALEYLEKAPALSYADVLTVHRILFSGFYPWAGRDRNELVPHLAVFKGASGDPESTLFEHPERIRLATDYALELASNHERFRQRPGEVMGLLAFAHPFLDGNGRTILLVFMELSYRAGFSIDWSRTLKEPYLQALSAEIRDPSQRFLDNYLRPYIVDISSRDQWPGIIGNIKGLDGLDKDGIIYTNLDRPDVQQAYKKYSARPYSASNLRKPEG